MSLGEQVFEVAERFDGDFSADVVRQEPSDSSLKVVDWVCAYVKGCGTSHADPKDAVIAGPKGTGLHLVVVREHALQTPSLTRYEGIRTDRFPDLPANGSGTTRSASSASSPTRRSQIPGSGF
jgi:hypothetical protein